MELKSLRKNKRGDITDTVVVLLIIFFLAISFIVVLFVNTIIQNVIATTALNESAAFSSIDRSFNTVNTVTTQRGFVIFFAVLVMGVMISSFLVRVHPIFLFLYITVISFAIFIAVFVGNIYDDIITNPTIASTIAEQAMINFIMRNIVLITLSIGALSMIIVFSKLFSAPVGGATSDFG